MFDLVHGHVLAPVAERVAVCREPGTVDADVVRAVARRDEGIAAVDRHRVAHVGEPLKVGEVEVAAVVVDDARVAATSTRHRGLSFRRSLVADEVERLAPVLRLPNVAGRRGEAPRRGDVDVMAAGRVQGRRDRQARLPRDPLVVDHHCVPERDPGPCLRARSERT